METNSTHKPYVPANVELPEFTFRAVAVGTLLGVLFGASSLYLVLKVGLTVSASIPVAVISLGLFRFLSSLGARRASILEHNIVQTSGSAGESLAFGIGVTMPAVLVLGFDLEVWRVMLVASLGGLLGILMMIPLRRALIVRQHGVLTYPEGTACAEVLKAGCEGSKPEAESSRSVGAGLVFLGFFVGLLYKLLMSGARLWKEVPEKVFGKWFPGGSISAEVSPELLGVGYIIGPRIASIVLAGGALSYLVLIPLVKYFGSQVGVVVPPGQIPISEMSPHMIRDAYILYIGAGAVAMGGIISMFRSLPVIISSAKLGIRDLWSIGNTTQEVVPRTEREIPVAVVLVGIGLLVCGIVFAPPLGMNLLGALLIILFGFVFVTVSSRLTGEIGSSSNPISGMTVATLLLTCLIFWVLGWRGHQYYVVALTVGAIVCVAAANGGTTSQDLKTGFLVGATPLFQQLAIMIGTAASALVLGPVLIGLNSAATVYVPADQVGAQIKLPINLVSGLKMERVAGVQAYSGTNVYRVWFKTDQEGGPAGKYLVNEHGEVVWYVDPGVNGKYTRRLDGTEVTKFYAPKAMLMSYIVKGVLGGELTWALVIIGGMIALVLELCGVSSLAFAVGVYLPISVSMPIFLGGILRGMADRLGKKIGGPKENTAAGENPGVLLASGYIAGGTMGGIIVAFSYGIFGQFLSRVVNWAEAFNPFYSGPYADLLSLVPFFIIVSLLVWVVKRH